MRKKILLLIGDKFVGLKILKKLKSYSFLDIEVFHSDKILKGRNFTFLKNKRQFISKFKKKKKVDFLILVYWPWLVPNELFVKFKDSINFHPSYLPIGRGWYPHVHAILKKLKFGITLHKISKGVDDGDLWCQKKIVFDRFSNSTDLIKIGKKEIVKLFNKNFIKIINRKILAKKQKGKGSFFKKKDVDKYDELKLNKKYKLIDLIRINNARKYFKKSFNFFTYKNEKYNFNIIIKKIK